MGAAILVISFCVQAWAAIQAARLAWRQRHVGWLLLAVANALMLARRGTSLYSVGSGQRTADPVAEFIALFISLLMAVGLTLLLRWLKEAGNAEGSPQALQNGALKRLQREAFLLALLALFGCAVMSWFTYSFSRDAVTGRLLKGSLDLANMLETTVQAAPDRHAALAELDRLWHEARSQQADNYLCVIGADGKLLLNTRRPDKVGTYVGGTEIQAAGTAPRTVQALVRARGDWAGRNRNSEGHLQIAAYAYSTNLDALVAVHLPAAGVDAEIRAAALPWGIGTALIFLVVLPLSFGLLYYVGSIAQRATFQALTQQLETDRRFSLLLENVKDHAIFLLDAEGRVANWNPGAETIRGWTEAEIKGRPLASFYTPEDLAHHQPEKDLATANERGRVELEGWRVRQNGARFWASVTLTSVCAAAGELTGYLVVTRDTTGKRESEAALRKYATVFENAGWGMVIADAQTHALTHVNPAFARMHGYAPKEMIGLNLAVTFAPEARAGLADHARAAHEKGRHSYESAHVRKDGSRFPCRTDVTTFKDAAGRILFRAATFEDITERQAAAAALRASEEKFRTIVESEPECVKIISTDGRLLEMNAAGLAMLECDTLQAVQERPLSGWLVEEYRKGFAELHRQVMQGGRGKIEFEVVGRAGTRRWLETHAAPLRDADGKVTALLGVTRDITEGKQAREKLEVSERRHRDFMNGVPVAAYLTDASGNITLYNEAAGALWGRKPPADEKWSGFPRLFTADGMPIRPEQTPMAVAVLEDRVMRGVEGMAERPDGTRLSFLAYATPVRLECGATAGAMNALVDITARKSGERALRRSESRFRRIMESDMMGMLFWNPNGDITTANDAFLRIVGHSRETLTAGHLNWADLTPPEYQAADEQARREIAATGACQPFEKEYLRKDGTRVPVLVGGASLTEQTDQGVAFVLDITQRRRADDRIRRLNRTYHVLSNINHLIVQERDPRKLMESACLVAVEKGGFRMAWIGLQDVPGGRVNLAAHAGATVDTLAKLEVIFNGPSPDLGCVFTQQSLTTGTHAVCNDIETDPRAACWRDAALRRDYYSMTALPLKVAGRTLGTFNLYASEPEFFDAQEMQLLDELATDISFAMEVSRRDQEHQQAEDELRAQFEELRNQTEQTRARQSQIERLQTEVNEVLTRQGQPPRYPGQENT